MEKTLLEKLNEDIKAKEENLAMLKEIRTTIEASGSSKKKMLRDFDLTFYLKNPNCDSIIERKDGVWVLKAGSITSAHKYWEENGGDQMPYARFYQKHIDKIDLIQGVVIKDIVDKSISNLVAISNGRPSSSGWTEPRTEEGQTPDEVYRR